MSTRNKVERVKETKKLAKVEREVTQTESKAKNTLEQLIDRLRGSPVSHERQLAEMFPPEKIEEIKKRELRRFKQAQDKKWRHWLEAISK